MDAHRELPEIIDILKRELPGLRKRYHLDSLGVFGSYRRRNQKRNSDLDLLVSFSETPSLLQFIELENYLEDLLEIKVDLVMQEALKPRIGKRILSEVLTIDTRSNIRRLCRRHN